MQITIWVDADSLPKDIQPLLIRRACAQREYEGTHVAVRFVAARPPPDIPEEFLDRVEASEGAADRAIENRCEAGDIVVTRDIPFAERIIARHAFAINDRGKIYTSDNIAERRSIRDAMASLRESGIAYPSPRGSSRSKTDTKQFADGLEKLIVRAAREKQSSAK
jgi:uncharacterized protein YaiI (UPF0178 family)